MWRFLLLVCMASTAIIAMAGAGSGEIVYVEDFEDSLGGPGFDPRFSHDITASPFIPDLPVYSELCEAPFSSEHGVTLYVAPAQDTMSFFLLPDQQVVHARVDVLSLGRDITSPDKYSIDFIGADATLRVPLAIGGWYTYEAWFSDIGPLQQIQIRGCETYFDNIALHVVPEPCEAAMTFAGLIACCAHAIGRVSRRK